MSSKLDRTIKKLAKTLDKQSKKNASDYNMQATVKRIEGDIAWVSFDGSEVNETPIQMPISAKPGDIVRVQFANNRAWITGNNTAPPTDDEAVQEVQRQFVAFKDKVGDVESGPSIAKVLTQYCACTDSEIQEGDTFEDIMVTEWLDHIPTPEDIPEESEPEEEEEESEETESEEEEEESEEEEEEEEEYIEYDLYVWMRTVTYMSDDPNEQNPIYSEPVYLPDIKIGYPYKFLIKTETEYCLATNFLIPSGQTFDDIKVSGLDWSTSQPDQQTLGNNYIWSRTKYYYSDSSVAYSDPVYDFTAQVAYEAKIAEESTGNYFWHDNSGAYISHNADHSIDTGSALRLVSEGILLKRGGNTLASFTTSGIQFNDTSGNAVMTYSNGGVSFNSSNGFKIGNNSTYIEWKQTNGNWGLHINASEITIGGDPVTGATGATGPAGATGATGPRGATGSTGPAGTVNGVELTSSGLKLYYNSSNYNLIGSSAYQIYVSGKKAAEYGIDTTTYGSSDPVCNISTSLSGGMNLELLNSSGIVTESLSLTNEGLAGFEFYAKDYANDAAWIEMSTYNDRSIWFGIGQSGTGAGIYDPDVSKWLIFSKSSKGHMPIVYSSSTVRNVTIGSDGVLGTSGSSRRYKHDISDISYSEIDPHKLYDLRVAQFKYNEDTDFAPKGSAIYNRLIPGFIAEEVGEVYNVACIPDDYGRADDWDHRIIIPAMLKLIQEQNDRITELERSN